MKNLPQLSFAVLLTTVLLPSAHANETSYPSSLSITNSIIESDSIELTIEDVNLAPDDEYFMSCREYNLELGIDSPSYTTTGSSNTLKIEGLSPETEYDCHAMIHRNDDMYIADSEHIRLKTYPSYLEIIDTLAQNDNITLTVANIDLHPGDQYFMLCMENNADLGIDSPSYSTSGTSSTLSIGELDNEGEYSCSVMIQAENEIYTSQSQNLSLKISTETQLSEEKDDVLTVFSQNPFPDTNINTLEGKAAAELYRRSVISGYPDGEFKGYKDVNRAEAAKFLLLVSEKSFPDLIYNDQFWDLEEGAWYVKYVITAAIEGIIHGHPDGSFRPGETVNTAEFLKMITLSFDLEKDLSYSYTDVQSSDWFSQYAGTAQKYDLFPNRPKDLLQPSKQLTRNEVAVSIYQYLLNR